MSKLYDDYIKEHQNNVNNAFQWIRDNLPEILEDVDNVVYSNCQWEHDKSKFNWDEYEAYDNYFYGKNRSYEVVKAFNEAWLRHIHRNPHHWQHWVLINDDPENGEIILDMPDEYIIEMICDWWSFSWKSGKLYEIFGWYGDHKDYIKLSVQTRDKVNDILEKIEEKLDELGGVDEKDIH